MLADAEALWRGEPYADARGSPTVEIEAARLDELRVVALEERLTAELASARHIEVAPHLEALVAAYPLRERLWERWILALYRCGRQAEALRACATIRARLRDELGVTPGTGQRELEAAVLDQLAELDPDPGAADLDPPQGLAWGGERNGAGASAGPVPGAGRGSNLPIVEPIVGRDDRPMLLVLDNCEHLLDDVAAFVSQLLAACPAVRVLCTSQESLAVHGEHPSTS